MFVRDEILRRLDVLLMGDREQRVHSSVRANERTTESDFTQNWLDLSVVAQFDKETEKFVMTVVFPSPSYTQDANTRQQLGEVDMADGSTVCVVINSYGKV